MKLFYRAMLVMVLSVLIELDAFSTASPNYILIGEYDLPDDLKETSGLFCSNNETAYTLNDSGNKPFIYEIDGLGKVINKRLFNLRNRDWEAITGDETHLYIGDVGNNSGKRKSVKIQKVEKYGVTVKPETIKISYLNNPLKQNRYMAHDFDAEALVNVNESLYLFSKSWDTGSLFIYQMDKLSSTKEIGHIAEIDGLPGVVTGGDYDFLNNRFVLVGYKLYGLFFFSPFITILDEQLNLVKSFELDGYGQVEGVCITSKGEVWFTQERSTFSKSKLVKINLVE